LPWLIGGLGVILLLAGCSSQDFARPIVSVTDLVPRRSDADADAEAEEARRRAEQFAAVLAMWERQRAGSNADFKVGPDDVLSVGILALEAPGQTALLSRLITKEGFVSLPLVGDVRVAGSNVREVEKRIAAAYEGRYLKNPQVSVSVAEYRSSPVVITGAVSQPGVYYLRHNVSSALEVISQANGLSPQAGSKLLIVRKRREDAGPAPAPAEPVIDTNMVASVAGTNGVDMSSLDMSSIEMIEVDLRALIEEGDMAMNVSVLGGDVVSVPPAVREYVYVLGYVQRPGAFELREGQELRALQAVALAGGLSASARAQNSFLVMNRPEGREVVPVNLAKIAHGGDSAVYLQPGDTLVVGSSGIAKLAEFIKPSVGASARFSPTP
jgi:polysaccharide export outer membrane protein